MEEMEEWVQDMILKSIRLWGWILLLPLVLFRGDPIAQGVEEQGANIGGATACRETHSPSSKGPLPEWLQNVTEDIASEHRVPPQLIISIILTESRGNPRRVSPKGAKGLMQLMPVVIEQYHVKDPYDPETNIRGGVKYLVDLLEEFSGNLPLALAAYNAGPTAVRRYKGIPPFEETQTFVRRVRNLFHSLDPRPKTVRPAMNSDRGEPGAADPRLISFTESPGGSLLGLKKNSTGEPG
jgi:hypothetical protein